MFGNRPPRRKSVQLRWLKGVLFGGMMATLVTCLFTPKSGAQVRRKLHKVKDTSAKQSKLLFKNSKRHTKAFAAQTKQLAKNISKDFQDFAQNIIDEGFHG